MALLRLLCSPSSTLFSSQQSFPQTTTSKSQQPNSLSLYTSSSFSPLLTIKTPKPNSFITHFSSSTAIETPELEQAADETVQVEDTPSIEEEEEAPRTRLLVSNIPWTCTADDLRPLFEKYGTVLSVEFSMYNKTRNRGLAFIEMGSPEEALAAFSTLESYEFEGRTLKLDWAKPKKKKNPPPQPKPVPIHNLFVANLHFQARAKDLKELFNSENANAVTAEIIYHDNPRRSAGYGFVSFNSKEEADEALEKFEGKMLLGRPIRVAPSKKFLRKTPTDPEPEKTSAELETLASPKVDEA